MIENDLKIIRKHHTKTNRSLKEISLWQVTHEKNDHKQFKAINNAIQKLPSQQFITDAVAESVNKTVNGKIDAVKLQLDQQDIVMKDLIKKISPVDKARTWLYETGKVLLFIGAISGALLYVLKLLKIL